MNKYIPFLVFAFLAIGVYFFIQPRNSSISSPPTSQESSQNPATPNTASGRYVPYTAADFAAAKGKKRVLFFFAPWCPTCVPTDKNFQTNPDGIPEDVILFKVDYDSSTDLKRKYGITYQHTFVYVDEEGNAIQTWNGGGSQELTTNTQ